MENPGSAMAPLLLRNLLTSIFIHADKSLLYLSQRYKLLQTLRFFLESLFLFFLSVLPSFFAALTPNSPDSDDCPSNPEKYDVHAAAGGDSGVSRALSQLLLIMNDIPVSSRKYEVVRSLAEKLIDENLDGDNRVLREVNRAVLSAAFARTLGELESAAAADQGRKSGAATDLLIYSRVMKGVKHYGRAAWRYAKSKREVSRSGVSAEKLAAEVLWVAQKMAACGCAEEAVCKWAAASNLAWLALSAEPRLQGSLVKVSAFLYKQAREMGKGEQEEFEPETKGKALDEHHIRQTKTKLLMSWLPLLCRANNGTDTPILSRGERVELESILEEMILTLGQEEQEWVLSLWLHHYTYCPTSDWPNLRPCYTRWFTASRASLVLATA